MSVQELFDFQEHLKTWIENPRAWVLLANPVWGSAETVNRIALFDTREQAEAYGRASELPKPAYPDDHKTKDGYYRTFRPDSLLWDYNPTAYHGPMIQPATPWLRYDGVVRNPVPPSGAAPDLAPYKTEHARYGVDYDRGLGGPYSNMDHAAPGAPPAATQDHQSSD
jgi:hypothetical protein